MRKKSWRRNAFMMLVARAEGSDGRPGSSRLKDHQVG
jgi:hypothetical protein